MLRVMHPRATVAAAVVIGVLSSAPWSETAAPHAQTTANGYTFTRIAEHGFPQVVEGNGEDPLPQVIVSQSPAASDSGMAVFSHAADFPLNRIVLSIGTGGPPVQYYGGIEELPALGPLGIDGSGGVYFFTSSPDPHCSSSFANCIIDPQGATIAVSTSESTLGHFIVNKVHPRLLPPGAPRIAFWASTVAGIEYHTELGPVARPGPEFTSIVSFDFDMNASGEVVFMAQTPTLFGIFAARTGQSARPVFLNYANPSVGFQNILNPVIDDSGRVYFIANRPGQFVDLYRIDPGQQEPVLVVDGNNGSLFFPRSLSVNSSGNIAFTAWRGQNGPAGIYTGPDPIANRVVEVGGDTLDGQIVEEIFLPRRALNNYGLDNAGQIVFAARLGRVFHLYRADPVGSSKKNPYMPLGGKPYKFAKKRAPCKGGCTLYIDPPSAIGYEYTLEPGNPNFESVVLPVFATVNTYGIQTWTGTGFSGASKVAGDVPHVFPIGGVSRFRVVNIPESLGLDVDDPGAFVTGLTFAGGGDVEITMTPLTAEAPPPLLCDLDNDRDVDRNDINVIMGARNVVPSPGDPRDANADGAINIVDARFCTVRCTRPNCGL